MKICFLTQTASDISQYYKQFFQNESLFFVTFKSENQDALAYVPKSTWSDGRNRLWEEVKGQYDYYVFMDDDLRFMTMNPMVRASPLLSYLYYKLYKKSYIRSYDSTDPKYFFSRIKFYLERYKPEIACVSQLDGNPVNSLDTMALRKNSFVRRVGFFDAQFTIMSNYAASKIMPYDTNFSGWSSAQIPVYLYSFHVFASKAINIIDLGVANSHHVGVYAENYDGMKDCKEMIEAISTATKKDYSLLSSNAKDQAVDYLYGWKDIVANFPKENSVENYHANFEKNLKGLETILHKNIIV